MLGSIAASVTNLQAIDALARAHPGEQFMRLGLFEKLGIFTGEGIAVVDDDEVLVPTVKGMAYTLSQTSGEVKEYPYENVTLDSYDADIPMVVIEPTDLLNVAKGHYGRDFDEAYWVIGMAEGPIFIPEGMSAGTVAFYERRIANMRKVGQRIMATQVDE